MLEATEMLAALRRLHPKSPIKSVRMTSSQLFGRKYPVVWLKNDATYQPPLDCAPCFERTCPLGHTRCLVDIRPDDVLRLL